MFVSAVLEPAGEPNAERLDASQSCDVSGLSRGPHENQINKSNSIPITLTGYVQIIMNKSDKVVTLVTKWAVNSYGMVFALAINVPSIGMRLRSIRK
jgi:hypothetical protein